MVSDACSLPFNVNATSSSFVLTWNRPASASSNTYSIHISSGGTNPMSFNHTNSGSSLTTQWVHKIFYFLNSVIHTLFLEGLFFPMISVSGPMYIMFVFCYSFNDWLQSEQKSPFIYSRLYKQ